jgi:integrase
VDDVKTEYSRDRVPLDPALVEVLQKYREYSSILSQPVWVFGNPKTGRPYHQEEIQKRYIKPAGKKIGLTWPVGWHTFRHSYRSWLDDTGAPMGVQKELMRHASIQTTMNVYGQAMSPAKREANTKVVKMALKRGSEVPFLALGA